MARRAVVAATLVALLLAAAAGWKSRGGEPQPPIRLLEVVARAADREAAAGEAPLEWRATPVERPPVVTVRWNFANDRQGWSLLDAAGNTVDETTGHEAWWPRNVGSALRFEEARGGVAKSLPANARRLLRVVATVRRAKLPADAGPAATPKALTRLVVQPTLRLLDLARDLRGRSYLDVANDGDVRIGAEPLFASAPAPADDAAHELAVTLVTPPGTRGLVVLLGAGDGTMAGAVELESVRIEELPLREALGLGTATTAVHDALPHAAAAAYDLGVQPAARATLPAVRMVEPLLDLREALLLPPPCSASFTCEVPAGDWLLEYGVARLSEARPGFARQACHVEVRVAPADGNADGAIAQTTTLPAGDDATAWIDRTLALGALSGRRLRFSFASESSGQNADVVAIGAPLLRLRRARDERWNVVLVSLDTVRADHLSAHGYPRPTTPNLDALARESAWFRCASSTSSYTLPAHASLLTGQLPTRHGAHSERPGSNRIRAERSDLLALKLRDAGWLNAAFTGGVYLRPGFGFAQGFDRYDSLDLALLPETNRGREEPRAGDAAFNARVRRDRPWSHALDWVRAHDDAPFFLFLHTYLVHEYVAAPANEARFLGSCESGLKRGDLKFIRDRKLKERPTSADLQRYVDAYDAALHEADARVGELLATLRATGLDDRTIVIVTSDHGEEFLDHGGVNHGRTLHEEMVRVPLLIRVPGMPAREIATPVSLVDVVPTLFELLALRADHEQDGRSLLPLLRGGTLPDAAIEAELDLDRQNRWLMRREGGAKVLEVRDERGAKRIEREQRPRAATRRMGFAAGVDPRETRDLASGTPDEEAAAAELFDALELQLDAARARREAARSGAAEAASGGDVLDLVLGGYVQAAGDEEEDEAAGGAERGEERDGGR